MNPHLLQEEIDNLDACIVSCKKQLALLPDGKLIIAGNGHYSKWYVNTNGHSSGIRYLHRTDPSDRALAEQLARKKVLTQILDESIAQKKALTDYLQSLEMPQNGSEKILSDHEYQKLLKHCCQSGKEDLNKWASEKYDACPRHPEMLIFHSFTGHVLRSKSELIIDMALAMHQIPFRYESPLVINNMTFYPDFTIRHPETGNYFYWEHFGMIDQPDYQRNYLSKMSCYIKSGIVPTINLITTYETKEQPLSSQIIEKMIACYLL